MNPSAEIPQSAPAQPESLLGDLLAKPIRRDKPEPEKPPTPYLDDLRQLKKEMESGIYPATPSEIINQKLQDQYMRLRYEAMNKSASMYEYTVNQDYLKVVAPSEWNPKPMSRPRKGLDAICGVCHDPNCPYSQYIDEVP